MDVGTALGAISLGIQLCDELAGYYNAYRNFREDIQSICLKTSELRTLLTQLEEILKRHTYTAEVAKMVESAVESCKSCNDVLEKEVRKFSETGPSTVLKEKVLTHMKRFHYSFRHSKFTKLQEKIIETREKVEFAVQVLSLDASTALQTKINTLGNDVSLLANLSSRIENSISQAGDDIRKIGQVTAEENRRRLRDWLNPSDISSFHDYLQGQRHPRTGEWFLRRPDFEQWKTQSKSVFWIHGLPGVGKSVLCSTIVTDLREYAKSKNNIGLGYFYFSSVDRRLNQRREHMLRALVSQLWAKLDCQFDELECLYNKCKNEDRGPTFQELEILFRNMIPRFSEVYIAIDAIDECTEKEDLLDDIMRMVEWQQQNLHLMAITRTEEEIRECLEPLATQKMQVNHQVDDDIAIFVRDRMKKDRVLRKWSDDLKDEIQTTVIRKADGMFLLAGLQLRFIRERRLEKEVREALDTIPRKIYDMWEHILVRVTERDESDLRRMLCWLAYSERALTLDEVAETVTIDSNSQPPSVDISSRLRKDDILDICANLTHRRKTVWSRDKQYNYEIVEIIILAHATLRDYLKSDAIRNSRVSKFWIPTSFGQGLICEACLTYVLQFDNEASLTPNVFDEWPLALYSAHYWPTHAKYLNPMQWTQQLETLCMKLLTSTVCFTNSIRIWDASRESYNTVASSPASELVRPPPPIDFVAVLGLQRPMELLLSALMDGAADANEKLSQALLLAAGSVFDVSALLTTLIGHGANVEARDKRGRPALHCAASAENLGAIRALLDGGADINALSSARETALHVATRNGCLSMMALLIGNGADVEAKGFMGRTTLQWSIFFPEYTLAAMDILLKHGAYINAQDDYGETALCCAVGEGNKAIDIIKFLLENSADVKLSNYEGLSPLHAVCDLEQDCSEVIELLLSNGADINALTNDRETPLHLALKRAEPSFAVVDILLHRGSDVKIKTSDGQTPLHIAAAITDPGISPRIISALLSNGADINAQDDLSDTPLDIASYRGCEASTTLLQAKGAHPTPKDRAEKLHRLRTLMSECESAEAQFERDTGVEETDFLAVRQELVGIRKTLHFEGLSRDTDDRLDAILPMIEKLTDRDRQDAQTG